MPETLDIGKLRKVAALMDSPHEGERQAAMERTRTMLAGAGKKLRDLLELLGSEKPTEFGFGSWAGFEDALKRAQERAQANWEAEQARKKAEAKRREEEYKAHEACRREQAKQRVAPFKAAVLRKYGSEEAALADDERQRAVNAAAAHLSTQGAQAVR